MVDMCACAEPDLAELAWAAGFFDGEGTTLAKSDSARPGYHQLVVTVPQLGREGVPEVLVRFQRAVLGMGVIERADDGSIFRWRARGFVDAQATIALLWRFLDGVKRTQAAAAMRTVGRQYAAPWTFRRRRPRSPAVRRAHASHVHPRASTPLDGLERAWAAGFFDGEGWTGRVRGARRNGAPNWYRMRASINQNGDDGAIPAVLLRFQRAVDGAGRIDPQGQPGAFKWVAEDLPAVERVLGQLRPWLGTIKVAQAQMAFDAFNAQVRLKGSAERCLRGHKYSGVRTRGGRTRRICRPCDRIRDRAKRAAKGIPPRQFKNVARRYNS